MASNEKYLERKFNEYIKSIKGMSVKGPSYMYTGIPDRIVVLPNGGGTLWVEFKGGTYYQLQPMQKVWRDILINSDPNRYFLVDNKEDLQNLIETCERLIDTSNKDVI
jgi:hypothetical protein